MDRTRAKAPARVTVYLGVGARQSDGYHEIATAAHAVSLYDFVTATSADDFSVSFTGPLDTTQLSTGAENLAIRAAMALARHARIETGVAIEIEKHVPVQSGLGGAAADAAATLIACAELWKLQLGRDELHRIAAKLGTDVPFALAGGTAVGTGRGDELSPAFAKGQFQWVIALSGDGLDKPDVYRALDKHRERYRADIMPVAPTPEVDVRVLQALRAGDAELLAEVLHNDLQAAALHLQPRISGILELGERAGALAGVVAGSGPSCAFLCADADSAFELQIALSAAQIATVKVTAPVPGARLID